MSPPRFPGSAAADQLCGLSRRNNSHSSTTVPSGRWHMPFSPCASLTISSVPPFFTQCSEAGFAIAADWAACSEPQPLTNAIAQTHENNVDVVKENFMVPFYLLAIQRSRRNTPLILLAQLHHGKQVLAWRNTSGSRRVLGNCRFNCGLHVHQHESAHYAPSIQGSAEEALSSLRRQGPSDFMPLKIKDTG